MEHCYLTYIILWKMERALFTKLIIDDPQQESEHAARNIINQLVENTADHMKQQIIQEAQIHVLSQYLSNIEYYTINQAYPGNNPIRTFKQDVSAVSNIVQTKRPMSAKVNYSYRTVSQKSSSNLKKSRHSQLRSSLRSTRQLDSTLTKSNRRFKFQKENQEYLFPIVTINSEDDLFNEQLIENLRKHKQAQDDEEKKKQDFFKTMASEEQKGSKIKKKWNQMMGNRNYYYSNAGEAIQVSKKTSKLTKKPQCSIQTTTNFRQQTTKKSFGFPSSRRIIPQCKAQNVYIEYEGRSIPSLNKKQMLVLDEKQDVVFHPSKNCKYTIVTG